MEQGSSEEKSSFGASLWFALGFLTTLPCPKSARYGGLGLGDAAKWFPLVGWLIGGALYGVAELLMGSFSFEAGLVSALILAFWMEMTGMIHFGGLVGSADALRPPVSVERRLDIFKDVHVGAFGVGVAVMFILLKWQALIQPIQLAPELLLFVPVVARFAVLLPMRLFPSARAEGMGAAVTKSMGPGGWLVAVVSAAPAFWFAPSVAVPVVIGTLFFAFMASRKLNGGLTGDVYGGLIELAELAGLITVCVLVG